ncbi:MAG TPA: hypothetical protein VMI74_04980 [Burkholderiales bacterium]|nr:hypothetical protein [Burkholderiales bacterium]
MSNRNSLSLFLVVVALVCLGWAVKSPAAVPQAPPRARPAPAPHCSQALASGNGIRVAKRVDRVPARAPERTCTSALRHRVA